MNCHVLFNILGCGQVQLHVHVLCNGHGYCPATDKFACTCSGTLYLLPTRIPYMTTYMPHTPLSDTKSALGWHPLPPHTHSYAPHTCWFWNILYVDGLGIRGAGSLLNGGRAQLLPHVEGQPRWTHVKWERRNDVTISLLVLLRSLCEDETTIIICRHIIYIHLLLCGSVHNYAICIRYIVHVRM